MTTDNFYCVNGNTSVKDIIKNLTKEITQNAGIYKWDLVSPSAIDKVRNFSLIKATTSYGKEFYIRFERTAALTPTSEEQKLLDKERYSKPFTEQEITLLNRYVEAMPLTSFEKNLIKKNLDSLTADEQNDLQQLRVRKNITNDRELFLLRKYYNGESLSTAEQNELDTYRNAHNLTAQELIDWSKLKTNTKLYADSIINILYKQYAGSVLSQSEQNSLASYRNSMELTQSEKEKLAMLKGKMDNRNHMYITIGKEIHDTKKIVEVDGEQTEVDIKDLVEESCSVPSRFAWYKKLAPEIGEWLPIEYYINITKDAVNIMLEGDKSADNYPYNNNLTSYAYIGAIKPMEDSASTDDKYNFGVVTSSDIPPFFTKKFGERTATGITDICMVGNKIGMPMQPHYPEFSTTTTFVDKCNTEGSRWNHKKHKFDEIILFHPVDGERGKLINVLAGDGNGIWNKDTLVYKKGTEEEENYKKFKITAPYSLMNNSPNPLYCIAIRWYKSE
ncbi:hypothetical protein PZQ55_001906 [Clostridium botulinum]|nr:hypothetical protein [Clostridium botulinum]EKO1912850.1 hypothetical protein [Clostridium botulinum]EKO2042911.1 hypothetical protein [Clostridium botulinum]MBO0575236.1 hypothetical protein [Clostridium botulinum]